MPTKKKLPLPKLPFRPLALKRMGDKPLLMDLPKADQRRELLNARMHNKYGGYTTITDLAVLFKTDTHSIARWFREGVRWEKGEDLCDHIGLHPVEVWPDYYQILADVEFEVSLSES